MILRQKPSFTGKLLLTFTLITISTAYAVWQSIIGGSTVTQHTDTGTVPITNVTASLPQENPITLPPSSMMSGPMMGRGLYLDGSYTGKATDAFYGILQVKAIVRGGKITDVQFLQHANSTENSRFINDRAMPLLTQKAIAIQGAQVDGVSGATFTSGAFRESLASALVQAKN
ncbi:FMN-binding protein [Candidatus Kaiserbacteria bacterium]|nr:FMN-binding protein [Candidatus Kaiserbacteria bacterium]